MPMMDLKPYDVPLALALLLTLFVQDYPEDERHWLITTAFNTGVGIASWVLYISGGIPAIDHSRHQRPSICRCPTVVRGRHYIVPVCQRESTGKGMRLIVQH